MIIAVCSDCLLLLIQGPSFGLSSRERLYWLVFLRGWGVVALFFTFAFPNFLCLLSRSVFLDTALDRPPRYWRFGVRRSWRLSVVLPPFLEDSHPVAAQRVGLLWSRSFVTLLFNPVRCVCWFPVGSFSWCVGWGGVVGDRIATLAG